jgi:DNA recombination-dependent growth factor C
MKNMGLISSTHSISRYHIEGKIEGSAAEEVRNNLITYSIPKLESEFDAISAGWTPFESPYNPDFEKFSIQFGTYFLFSLRIDKKSIPMRLIQKYMTIEIEKKMEKTGRQFISKNEKTEIKEMVIDLLMHKIPAVPSIYEILWNYEEQNLYLFTTQKAANELFETLFFKSFKLKPVRLFPYTLVETKSSFSNSAKDRILSLSPLKYTR